MLNLPSTESLNVQSFILGENALPQQVSGEVIGVTENDFRVLFETDQGRLEETYQASELLPGYVPEIGDQVVTVQLLAIKRKASPAAMDEVSGEKVPPAKDVGMAWSAAKDARRCELIDKKIQGTLEPAESREFAELQRQALEYFDRVAPPPLDGARKLHATFLKKVTQQQER